MTSYPWKITLRIHRKRAGKPASYQDFEMEASPDEYILDAIERVWAYKDRSLTFAHACHHSVCGACGMRINGIEKLSCITQVRDVAQNGSVVLVEPLRNFPVLSDLVVDVTGFQLRLDDIRAPQVLTMVEAPVSNDVSGAGAPARDAQFTRLVDCIECGMCISACPVAATSEDYLGPAVLAAVHLEGRDAFLAHLEKIDAGDGIWRCHSAYECTEVCPSSVEPAWRIMELRKQVIVHRLKSVFGGRSR